MKKKTEIKENSVYKISGDLATKDIEGSFVIVPLKSGIGDLNTELYALNDTGVSIWEKLDGTTPLHKIIYDTSMEFDAPYEEIQKDIMALITDLLKKGLIVEG